MARDEGPARYLNKRHADAELCLTISKTILNGKKREMPAAICQRLAAGLEKIIATNAIVDHERDKRLMRPLSSDDGLRIGTKSRILFGQHGSQDKTI